MSNIYETFTPSRRTATGTVTAGSGRLGGFFCTTGGTVKLHDGTDTDGDVIVDQFTVEASVFYPLPFAFAVGLHAVLGGGASGTFGITN